MAHTVTRPTIGTRVRHANRSRQAREQAYASLAAAFTRQGWTPDAMEACERVFGSETPVADPMTAAVR